MSGQTVNVKDFKCVPIDLLKNINENGDIQVKNDNMDLTDVREETIQDVLASGQIKRQPIDAKLGENILIFIIVFTVIIFSVLYFYIGPSNVSELVYRKRMDIMFLAVIFLLIGAIVMGGYAIWAFTR